ncbi:MAG: endonuclease/exonuclease/phosphatase family protein [Alphaproteobacteria bacterium]|nr:endonuclease/exonuclease/phosphatase family protein [Alphaproteobacteria bacterium]
MFTFYYTIGSLFSLAAILIFCRGRLRLVFTALMIVIAVCSFAQTRYLMADPFAFGRPPITDNLHGKTFKVAQYNKLHSNQNHDRILKWVEEDDIDLLILQEVIRPELLPLKRKLSTIMPYAEPIGKMRPDAYMVLSRYKIENYETKLVCVKYCTFTRAIRFDVVIPENEDQLEHRVRVYTVHTQNPLNDTLYRANYEELEETALWIASDKDTERILFMGDWNTTIYSPAFKNVLKIARLNHQSYDIVPENTWPAYIPIKALRLSIDHILYKGQLNLLNKYVGKALGSDHHSIIANFAIE